MLKLGFDLGPKATFDDLLIHQALLNVPAANCTDQEVRTVLSAFEVGDLRRLDEAFQRGLVIRRNFTSGEGRGCLLYHLNNAIVSFGAQVGYFARDKEAYQASQHLIAAWDGDVLTEERMRGLLTTAIRERLAPPPPPSSPGRDPWAARLTDGVPTPSDRRDPDREANRFHPTREAAAKRGRPDRAEREPARVAVLE